MPLLKDKNSFCEILEVKRKPGSERRWSLYLPSWIYYKWKAKTLVMLKKKSLKKQINKQNPEFRMDM